MIEVSTLRASIKLFDNYFLDQAIEDLMPKTENDFNNFKDTVYDKFNRAGYIIQRGKYYIFQPFDENEDVTMYYRKNLGISPNNMVSIENYVKQKYGDIKSENDDFKDEDNTKKNKIGYNFISIDSIIDGLSVLLNF